MNLSIKIKSWITTPLLILLTTFQRLSKQLASFLALIPSEVLIPLQGNSPVYPLTSKLPEFKKFRRSLSEFLDRLIQSAAELGSLYDSSDLMLTFQAWVIAMSSSQIRSFRHTATVIALEVETVLADIAAKIDKEAEMVTRQREGEKKRAGANNGKKVTNGKTHEYDTKLSDIKSRKNQVEEFLKDFIDGSVQLCLHVIKAQIL